MDWLGFRLDTVKMEVTIPPEKLSDVILITQSWETKDRATRKDLQSLAGKLNHIAQCVLPARRFMSRILALLRSVPRRGTVAVDAGLRRDLAWFSKYAKCCNGRLLIQRDMPSTEIQCDACPTGAGGFSSTHYYSLPIPLDLAEAHHISRLEAANAIVTLKTLVPPSTTNTEVVLVTDNSATMFALSSGKTCDPVLVACSGELWLIAALQEFWIVVRHAPGETLVLADALSCRCTGPHFEDIVKTHVKNLNLSFQEPVDITKIITDTL